MSHTVLRQNFAVGVEIKRCRSNLAVWAETVVGGARVDGAAAQVRGGIVARVKGAVVKAFEPKGIRSWHLWIVSISEELISRGCR